MIYGYEGNLLDKYPTLVGDGITDDTEAFQDLVDSFASIHLPANLKIKITDTIEIDPAKLKMLDGGGCTILISGDITAFKVNGSLTSSMTANPDSIPADIKNLEGGFMLCNFKIQGNEAGTAIELDGCFKPTIRNCYIHNVKTGIVIENQCRDILILGNHIYGCQLYGILVDESANIHQCNINDNIINYAYYCIYLNKCRYTANFQIVGNDIEISTYPGQANRQHYRCIMIDASEGETSTSNGLNEIEIVGNTIQGHAHCDHVIEFAGQSSQSRYINNININGNHISNSSDDLIVITNAYTAIFNGNTIKDVTGYAFAVGEHTGRVSITDNNATGCGGFVKQTSACERMIVANNISNTNTADPYNIAGTNLTNAIIQGNVVSGSNTGMVVNPTNVTRVMVANNIVGSGSYTLHNDVTASNNV